MERIGVFVCHCGLNIAGTVDVEKIVEEISKYPLVAHAEHYIYNCSDPGQDRVRTAIREKKLEGLVMANCSPSLHQVTFRNLAISEGLNPYHCEIANIREVCSWPHANDKEVATKKALNLIKATIEKLKLNEPLNPPKIPITKKALIIGGGVAGMEAALTIAYSGYEVVLVERNHYLGGHAVQISGTFLSMDWSPCIITPRMTEIISHPNITLYLYSEIQEVSGYIGNFDVKIRRKPAFVNWEKCNGCLKCQEACPVSVPSEFDRGLGQRKAIYIPYEQAVPNKPVVDTKNCLYFKDGSCKKCSEVCPENALEYEQGENIVEEQVGAIMVATGYELYDKGNIAEYALDVDVVDGLAFERMLSPTGPTRGIPRKPSDGSIPKEIVWIQCVGSRDPEHGVPYCSKVCCMYTSKQALFFKRAVPDGQAYVFYMDVRSTGKGYEEFVKEAVEEGEILYLRGRVSKLFREGDKIIIWGTDTLTGKNIEVAADMVVLATAIVPSPGAKELGRELNIITDTFGFVTEAHLKLRPVETLTGGIFLGGAAQGPKDIPDSVYQAGGAAAKILSLFSNKELLRDPAVAYVDEEICAGCGYCVEICSYNAPQLDPIKRISRVNEALCEGCGACAALCPSGAMQLTNFTTKQAFNIIDVAVSQYE
ncbi:MAG: CoB--CoM heterodisulfide reductase iron-sulfur subunit A family protein [Thermodesulfobacteriota bacterium]|nr:CoB--CoM heterodisulfide reductase iron-sulfur subunit A family protein [Thermodesulfobacteriota bacterium]